MEMIHEGEPKAGTGLYQPEELSNFHDNERTKWTTSPMDAILSQYNFKIEYRPGKEGGKPDANTRWAGHLQRAGDKRLWRKVGILLPKESYWDIADIKEIKLDGLETTEFPE